MAGRGGGRPHRLDQRRPAGPGPRRRAGRRAARRRGAERGTRPDGPRLGIPAARRADVLPAGAAGGRAARPPRLAPAARRGGRRHGGDRRDRSPDAAEMAERRADRPREARRDPRRGGRRRGRGRRRPQRVHRTRRAPAGRPGRAGGHVAAHRGLGRPGSRSLAGPATAASQGPATAASQGPATASQGPATAASQGPATAASQGPATATPEREPLLIAILGGFERWYQAWCQAGGDPDRCGLRAGYTELSGTIGRRIRAELPGGQVLSGLAVGVDPDGRLLVRSSSGTVLPVAAGDVVHLR